MNERQLNRYSRQLLLTNFDIEGQLALNSKHAVIIGVGGLGNIAAAYLAGAGVGRLTLVDHDQLEESNLPRQVLYQQQQLGQTKVAAAAEQINSRNEDTIIQTYLHKLDAENIELLLGGADVILDCCDNFATRRLVHRWALKNKVPLVSGAAIRWEGQLVTFRYDQQSSPCYECLYPELSDQQLSCNVSGIIGPVVGTIGVMQALEAMKILSGCGEVVHGRLKLFDGFNGQWREMRLTSDPECVTCTA